MEYLPILILSSGGLSLLSLLILHFVSPEFAPSWRMVSEYALGKHKWLITAFFLLWGTSSFLTTAYLFPQLDNAWGYAGLVLLFISGIGEVMGGLFDVKHKKHGLAFLLGIPTLPIAALLIGYQLLNKEPATGQNTLLLVATHAPWISLVVMGTAMGIMMSGFKKSGLPMGPDAPVPDAIPDGVIALAGYANRLLVGCYVGWLLVITINIV